MVPVLVALVVGRYIERFKGFGLELETTLQLPVTTLDLTASELVSGDASGDKSSLQTLSEMPWLKKQKMRRLRFVAGRAGYYHASVVEAYLSGMPNLEHLEFQGSNGRFVGFLPASEMLRSRLETSNRYDTEKIKDLIKAIETNKLDQVFETSIIKTIVKSSTGLVDLHTTMTADRVGVAAIEDAGGKFVGVVYLADVHKRMAETLTALRKTSFQG